MNIINKQFYEYIFPSRRDILRRPKVSYDLNNVIFKNIIIFGFQGSGKTVTANSIAAKAVKKYGQENVNARVSEDGDLGSLIRWSLRPTLLNLLFSDNTTLRKLDRQDLMDYFRVRHIFKDRFNLTNGYILSIIALHRFHSIPVELRTTIDGILVKNSSMNPYDKNILQRFIGPESLELLEKITCETERRPELKRFSIFVGRNIFGLVSLPIARKNYLEPAFDITEILKDLESSGET
jgi:hypothetical protein